MTETTYFNRIYDPEELPEQLNTARHGNVMCASIGVLPWGKGTFDWKRWQDACKGVEP